jgi:hypothetical protein
MVGNPLNVHLEFSEYVRVSHVGDVIKGVIRPRILILYRAAAAASLASRSTACRAGQQRAYFAAASSRGCTRTIGSVPNAKQFGDVDNRRAACERDRDLICNLHILPLF